MCGDIQCLPYAKKCEVVYKFLQRFQKILTIHPNCMASAVLGTTKTSTSWHTLEELGFQTFYFVANGQADNTISGLWFQTA